MWLEASGWAWAAVAATALSVLGYALQTLLDYFPAPGAIGFAIFWGLFAGDAVIGFLTGIVAITQGRHSERRDATLAFGLVGVGWLVLAQAIQLLWN